MDTTGEKGIVKITSPIRIRTSKSIKGKRYSLNLNQYRNWHFHQSNAIKNAYLKEVRDQLDGKKFKTPIKIKLKLFKGSKRKSDRSNVLCIVEKFFCDALVFYNCIPDDNDEYIKSTYYETGGIDKENPRCEITILKHGTISHDTGTTR